MKKCNCSVKKFAGKLIGKLSLFALIGFVVTFAIYMFNGENKLIYYVIYPFMHKYVYDKQVRDRKI